MNKKLIKNLAAAVVKSGVNVQEGEEVFVLSSVYAVELTREVVRLAYERGAKRVHVRYRDDELNKLDFKYQTEETLTNKPAFLYDERNYFAKDGGCVINIICDDPNGLSGADSDKITASRRTDMRGLTPYYDMAMSNKIKWSIIAYPHPEWAKLMFPDLDEKDAMKKLGKYIAKTTRVDCDDPVKEWKKHSERLSVRCEKLNAAKIKTLHYKNKLGTDVTVGLPKGYVFGGGAEDCNGVSFNANMPTEEVFSAPDCNNVNGVIKASLPLCYNGKIIKDLSLTLKDGEIVDYDAKTNRDVLKGIIESDDGAKRLGEVALVPYDSPISKLGVLFYETLFDENASCHFAIGKAYPTCVKGGDKMSKDKLDKLGINDSDVHVDFMVGTKDLEITAETEDGKTFKVFENGNFTKDFE
ncbi:MAG: aminopeptidase [Clostridiales bacterium]|nr:aminopeptidase [Clostridiales bacterium]